MISIYNSFVKLTRNDESNNLYLHLARDGCWQRKSPLNQGICRTCELGSSSLRVSDHNPGGVGVPKAFPHNGQLDRGMWHIQFNRRGFRKECVMAWQVRPPCSSPKYCSALWPTPRKKIKTMATLPNDPRVIYKTRKRFNSSLTVRKNWNASEISILKEDPLSGPANDGRWREYPLIQMVFDFKHFQYLKEITYIT